MQIFYDHKMSYWVTCFINKGNMNGQKKCMPQQSSPLYFDFFFIKMFNNNFIMAY